MVYPSCDFLNKSHLFILIISVETLQIPKCNKKNNKFLVCDMKYQAVFGNSPFVPEAFPGVKPNIVHFYPRILPDYYPY